MSSNKRNGLLLNDFEDIRALKNGDRGAFEALLEAYQHVVFNVVLNIVQHQQDAEDITQEVFISIFNNIGQFRGEAKLSTWMYRIAVSKALEWERKKKARKAINYFKNLIGIDDAQIENKEFCHPGIALQNKENAILLFQALKKIPEKQMIAFLLVKSEGLSYQEVAAIMGKTAKSVEGLMQRAKENLRKQLQEHYQ